MVFSRSSPCVQLMRFALALLSPLFIQTMQKDYVCSVDYYQTNLFSCTLNLIWGTQLPVIIESYLTENNFCTI